MAKKEYTFEQRVQNCIRSLKNTMKHARVISEIALQHFHDHGDTSRLQIVLDAFEEHGKNFVRIAAFKKWAAAHSPLTMQDGKLVKDKSENAVKWDLEGALAKPFWEFAPDKEDFVFGTDDLLKLIDGIVRKTERENAKPLNEDAEALVVDLKRFRENHTKVNQDLEDEAAKAVKAV